MIFQLDKKNINQYIGSLTDLYIEVFSAPPRFEKLSHQNILDELKDSIEEKYLFMYLHNSEIVGVLILQKAYHSKDYEYMSQTNKILKNNPNSLFITESFVKKEHRGNGISSALFKKALSVRSDSNRFFSRSRVDAVEQNNLFTKFGFTKISKTKVTTNGVTSEKILWTYTQ